MPNGICSKITGERLGQLRWKVRSDDMRKFKVGDEVKLINPASTFDRALRGIIGKVVALHGRGYEVALHGSSNKTRTFQGRELCKKGEKCPYCGRVY